MKRNISIEDNKYIINYKYYDNVHNDAHLSFDVDGYVVKANGFGKYLWKLENENVDEKIIGMHINDLCTFLKQRACVANFEKYVIPDFYKAQKQIRKKVQRKELDLKTKLYLNLTKAERIEHMPVTETHEKLKMPIRDIQENEVYIFESFEEYRNFYLMYLDNIDDEVIKLAIYTRGSKGQLVARRRLCERIIIRKKVNDFYNSITQKQIDEIHAKGKLTPLEKVQEWEENDLCAIGDHASSAKEHCHFFFNNCHECLMEAASHKLEYGSIYDNFKIINSQIGSGKQKKLEK